MKNLPMVRPAHILRMCHALNRTYPELDYTNVVAVGIDNLQTRFSDDTLAGCHLRSDDTIYIGLRQIPKALRPQYIFANTARTLLHELIHREQRRLKPNSKAHGKTFQKLCLKYGLDPMAEIEHDRGQKLKVKRPLDIDVENCAIGISIGDAYEGKAPKGVKKIAKRMAKERGWLAKEWKVVAYHAWYEYYYSFYPAYKLCEDIVSKYPEPKSIKKEK